jgi:flavin reductase (DIM6/NTAB) family NADH-FMN oxidoreductase RutF
MMWGAELADEGGPGLSRSLSLYRRLAAGVSVVTTRGDDPSAVLTGMTASSVTSVSLRPALLLVSVAHRSRTLAAIRSRRAFAVHLLRRDQRDLARRFAAQDDRQVNDQVVRTVLGVPVLTDVLAWSVCLLEAEHAHGDHTLVIGAVAATHIGVGRPLIWHDQAFAELTG